MIEISWWLRSLKPYIRKIKIEINKIIIKSKRCLDDIAKFQFTLKIKKPSTLLAYSSKLALSKCKLLHIIFRFHKKYFSTNILGTPLLSSEASIFIPKENSGNIPLALAICTEAPNALTGDIHLREWLRNTLFLNISRGFIKQNFGKNPKI